MEVIKINLYIRIDFGASQHFAGDEAGKDGAMKLTLYPSRPVEHMEGAEYLPLVTGAEGANLFLNDGKWSSHAPFLSNNWLLALRFR